MRCTRRRLWDGRRCYKLFEGTPDHSSLSRIRHRLPLEAHKEVFAKVVEILQEEGLLRGRKIGVDASNLEANAAMRSIRRKIDGKWYTAYLRKLAKESGREELRPCARKRGMRRVWLRVVVGNRNSGNRRQYRPFYLRAGLESRSDLHFLLRQVAGSPQAGRTQVGPPAQPSTDPYEQGKRSDENDESVTGTPRIPGVRDQGPGIRKGRAQLGKLRGGAGAAAIHEPLVFPLFLKRVSRNV